MMLFLLFARPAALGKPEIPVLNSLSASPKCRREIAILAHRSCRSLARTVMMLELLRREVG